MKKENVTFIFSCKYPHYAAKRVKSYPVLVRFSPIESLCLKNTKQTPIQIIAFE